MHQANHPTLPSKNYLGLMRAYPREFTFLMMHPFFSGLGQTFFIALFVPHFHRSFELTATSFGLIYSVATLVSGLMLSVTGPLIDRWHLKYFSAMAAFFLLFGYLCLSLTTNIPFLIVGLFLVRLGGQGLISLAATTATARFFLHQRGKSLSLTNFGFPLGEALFPPLAGWLIFHFAAPPVLMGLGVSCFFVFMLGLIFLIPYDHPLCRPSTLKSRTATKPSDDFNRWDAIKTPFFLVVALQMTLPAFLLTGFFFHQATLANEFGISLVTFANAFIGWAAARVILSFISGPLVDQWGATRLVPYVSLPFAAGLLLFSLWQGAFSPYVYLFMAGVSVGFAGPIYPSCWAEVFGTTYLGSIKSLVSTATILSTSVSPVLFGYLFDQGMSAKSLLMYASGGLTVVAFLVLLTPQPGKGAYVENRESKKDLSE